MTGILYFTLSHAVAYLFVTETYTYLKLKLI